MRCEEIMKSEVECASPQDTVQEAARRMRENGIGFLPVCDAARQVLGTVTDRDLAVRVLAEGRPATTALSEVFTREAICCSPGDDLRKAEELMARHHVSRMLCVDESGRLTGVISLSDVAEKEEGARASQILRRISAREVHAGGAA